MANNSWAWKGKDGSQSRLLYESGNWGDLLKLLWIKRYFEWADKQFGPSTVKYLDPFAGAPVYPLGARTKFRFEQARLSTLDFITVPFVLQGCWPSTAMAVSTLGAAALSVFDIDSDRFAQWKNINGVTPLPAASGWDILDAATPEPNDLWLIDPYDFVAEWRSQLPRLLDKAGQVSMIIYIYNRSAKNAEAFGEYRAMRNAIDDRLPNAVKRIGRIASDAFLPRAHHELLFLPAGKVVEDLAFSSLLSVMEEESIKLSAAQGVAGVFDC